MFNKKSGLKSYSPPKKRWLFMLPNCDDLFTICFLPSSQVMLYLRRTVEEGGTFLLLCQSMGPCVTSPEKMVVFHGFSCFHDVS